MARHHLTPEPTRTEEALLVLFCLPEDAYYRLNPKGRRYKYLKCLTLSLSLQEHLPQPRLVVRP
jgi:hypothetical protein